MVHALWCWQLLHDGAGNIWPASLSASAVRSTRDPIHVKLLKSEDAPSGSAGTELPQPNCMQHTSDKPIIITSIPASGPGSRASTSASTAGSRSAYAARIAPQSTTSKPFVTRNPVPPDARRAEADSEAAAAEEEEAGSETVDASTLYGALPGASAAGSGLAVSEMGLHEARRRFRQRLKFLLRTRIARDTLKATHSIDHKMQGAMIGKFVDSTQPPEESELCAVGFDQKQIDLVLEGTDFVAVGVGTCRVPHFLPHSLGTSFCVAVCSGACLCDFCEKLCAIRWLAHSQVGGRCRAGTQGRGVRSNRRAERAALTCRVCGVLLFCFDCGVNRVGLQT